MSLLHVALKGPSEVPTEASPTGAQLTVILVVRLELQLTSHQRAVAPTGHLQPEPQNRNSNPWAEVTPLR